MKLRASIVASIFEKCLPIESSVDETTQKKVEGIVITAVFDKEKLEQHREEICSLLEELPDDFKKSKGGGMSFLNMVQDKNNNCWTGEHCIAEYLLLLGMAIGKVSFNMPRHLWSILPGGVPYLFVED